MNNNNFKYQEISNLIKKYIDKTEIFDMHTHLFPPEHKSFYLIGLKNVLNYHYLIAELLTSTDVEIKEFNLLTENEKASLIWSELFQKRTPISEACQGVLSILKKFSITIANKDYYTIDKELKDKRYTDQDIFNQSNVKSVVMTNNPFDKEEWSLFDKNNWDRNKYLPSLRLDNLFFDFENSLKIAIEHISNNKDKNNTIIKYLESCYQKANPVYAAVSLNGKDFDNLLNDDLWLKILNWLKSINLPLSLMLGVKRRVNKNFGMAGDGVGEIDLKDLSKLCNLYQENKFLVTALPLNSQYELTVLARKHPNLKIFGFWWFMNQPSIIEFILKMRIDLLGLSFIPQHSDARITDQLIYKWSHFKEILHKVLSDYYIKLSERNFEVTESLIKRDISNLLMNNVKKFLSLK